MWLFNLLLRLYPAGFRAEYEASLRQAAAEELEASGTFRFVVHCLSDFLVAWPPLILSEVRQDVQYTLRSWGRTPGLTSVAVLTLALAIGVSTGAFAVLHATAWRSLPFQDPARLTTLEFYYPPVFDGAAAYRQWRERLTFFAATATFTESHFHLKGSGSVLRVTGAETTSNFFTTLGVPLYLGRGFSTEEDSPGRNRVAVLSHGLFEQSFGGDRRVIGQTIHIAGSPLTVIGIAPPGFDYPRGAAFWSPTLFDQEYLPKSGVARSFTFGRLATSQTPGSAEAALNTITAHDRDKALFPEPPRLTSFPTAFGGDVSRASQLLFAAVCGLLFIACTNLAHLFLTRFEQRAPEFQLRSWLGASPSRLTQQLLTECLLLALLAGAFALLIAAGAVRLANHFYPPEYQFQEYDLKDLTVFGFAVAATFGTGLVLGLLPRFSLHPRSASRLRSLLLWSQAALTTLLLLAAFHVGYNLAHLHQTDLGYNTAQVDTATISLAGTPFEAPASRREFLRRALDATTAAFPTSGIGAVDFLPMSANAFMAGQYRLPNRPEPLLALHVTATPGFFSTIQTALLAGRDFANTDTANSQRVALVNENFARQAGGPAAILGKPLQSVQASEEPAPVVVGVVQDFRFAGPPESAIPAIFLPFSQSPMNFFTIVVGRPAGVPSQAARLRQVLAQLDAGVPVYDAMPFADRLARALARPNFYGIAAFFCGGFALLLTAIHLYSLTGHAMLVRQRELAIRQAVGASPNQLRALLVTQHLWPLSLGLAAGALASYLAQPLLARFIEKSTPAPWLWQALAICGLALLLTAAILWQARHLNARARLLPT